MGFLRNNQTQPMSYDMSGMLDDAGVSDGSPGNVLAAIAAPPAGATYPGSEAQPEQSSPRRRVSALDIIGAVLDAGAQMGGSAPGYAPQVDRRRALEQEAQDRAWAEKFNQQKFTTGNLGIEGAQDELANNRSDRALVRYGQASRGLGAVLAKHGPAGVQKAYPLLAKQLGMNDTETQIFGQALADDPEGTIAMLSAATTPENNGSPPKEKVIADILRQRDPTGKLESQYLGNIAAGMTGYQSGNLALGRDKLASNERIAAIRARAAERAARIRAASTGNKVGKGGVAHIDPATLDLALGVTGELRGIYDDLKNQGAAVSPSQSAIQNIAARARASGFGQLVEGALGTEAQTNRDKISGIRPNLIRRISEATGMTAAQMNSDKDMKLLLDQATDPTMSYEANIAAIDRLEELIVSRAGGGMGGGGGSPRPRIRLKPRNTPAPGKILRYNPATGNIE